MDGVHLAPARNGADRCGGPLFEIPLAVARVIESSPTAGFITPGQGGRHGGHVRGAATVLVIGSAAPLLGTQAAGHRQIAARSRDVIGQLMMTATTDRQPPRTGRSATKGPQR